MISKHAYYRKRKELRTLKAIQKSGVPKVHRIALEGMIKRMEWAINEYEGR